MTTRTLPEYEGNAFIEALGPPRSSKRLMALMSSSPEMGDADRLLPSHLRRHCLYRIKRWMQPRACQLELADTIDTMLRQAYIGRNPQTGSHQAAILDAADFKKPDDLTKVSSRGVTPTSMGFALLGHPGMGKTTTLNRIVESYPLVVEHRLEYAVLKQVPIIQAEMPPNGSLRSFCIDIIRQIGRRLGIEEEFKRSYLHSRATVDTMTLDLARLVQLHAVGLLVADELQHLNQSSEDPQKLMNFLTSLANLQGVSVVLVGTVGATLILEKQFRVARRSAGEPEWKRLRPGEEWNDFVDELWQKQCVREPVQLTEELSACLYDESQGLLDIAVKLFHVAQRSAIWRGEVGMPELLTVELLRETAKTHFHIVQPIIRALRDNRPDHLIGFGDLEVLRDNLDSMLAGESGLSVEDMRRLREDERQSRQADPLADTDWRAVMANGLRNEGYGADVAEVMIAEVARLAPKGGFLARMKVLQEVIAGNAKSAAMPQQADARKLKNASTQRRGNTSTALSAPVQDVEDLRFIAKKAIADGIDIHKALVDSGACKSLSDVLGGA